MTEQEAKALGASMYGQNRNLPLSDEFRKLTWEEKNWAVQGWTEAKRLGPGEEYLKQMENIIASVNEVTSVIDQKGRISLADAEKICLRHGVPLDLPLSELAVRYHIDYASGVIK